MDSINESSSDAIQLLTMVLHNVNLTFDRRTSDMCVTPVGQYYYYDTRKNDVEVSEQVKKSEPSVLCDDINDTL